MMNIDFWEGELTIYEGVSVDDEDAEVLTLIKNEDGKYYLSLNGDFEIQKDEDVNKGLAELDTKTYFWIRRKK